MSSNNTKILIQPDRSAYPQPDESGQLQFDLSSGKYVRLWHGPNHPGVTGNMSLELTVCGDEVVEAKSHVGYLHRGFEKLFERRTWMQCFPTVVRMCVPEPDSNEYNLAAAMEELTGVKVPEYAQWMRTLVLEMARIGNLLRLLPAHGGTLGLGLGVQWGVYLRDLILDRFEELTGARIYHMYMIPGGVRGKMPEGFKDRLTGNLNDIDDFLIRFKRLVIDNAVFKKRAVGTGYVDPSWVDHYGIVGPNARAAGYNRDVRKDNPYLVYDQLDFEPYVDKESASDVFSRTWVRYMDLKYTVDLIRQILGKMPKRGEILGEIPNALNWKIPAGQTYVRSESSRGEYGFFTVSDGTEYPRRINLRGPSYTHAIALLEKLLVNANISDISVMMVSLATCPPEIER
ncbi:NADH-quinone oxidoreductase subunit D [Saccharicrinis sp. FJH62]|uniref:NADH-quinone oxidoreductase subunit D n=1 Tax=Saccharicrinis sp. FJH62 TaxID=3344657 RepID=UPI0035D43551